APPSLWQTFPVSQHERKLLLAKLEPMTDKGNEPRDDIRVPCTRIVTQLKKQVAEAGPDPTSSPPAVVKPAATASGGGSSGRTSSGTAPPSRTVGGLNSRGRGATPGGESRGSLSATARPYVPAPTPGSATASNSNSNSAAVKRESQQQQQQKQQQPVGASHASKREPPSGGGTLAAAALAAG
ncbi:unnamed protein product, partial [Laminaria digitata]